MLLFTNVQTAVRDFSDPARFESGFTPRLPIYG